MNILVTGGTGFIGSHLVDHLLARGYRVRCLIRRNSNLTCIQNKGVEFVYGDLLDKKNLEPAVKGIEYVFHLAALSMGSIHKEFYRVNVSGTRNLLEVCCGLIPDL